MNSKKKFLMVLLSVVALGLLLGHFAGYTVWVFGKTVVPGLAVLLVVLKFLGGIAGMHFFL